ncbi:MAG: PLP-dependent aminotransferase family protein [Solirubrobacteraceae bacterium]
MPGSISFARGAPSLDIVDVDGLREAAEQAFRNDPGGMTAYGTAVGYVPLREWMAEYHGVGPEQVLVTNGSMQADAFLFDALVADGDTVIVERPTYDRTLLSLRNRGADVRMVELEPDGIDTAALERVLVAGAQPKLAHIIPNFQNPAGYTLSAAKRERLVELARTHGFTIFEDDPYVTLRFEGESLPTMFSTAADTVVYASSFSKTVCPGIRVGYLVGPADLIARIVKIATSTYISPNMVAPGIVNQFCRSGAVDRSIATVRNALRERARTLCDELSEHLPDARFVAPEGGYFLWVDLPDGTDVAALFDAAAARGVQFVKGTDFMLEGGESSLRLAYSGVPPAEIREGVKRLADAYAEVGRSVNAA